MSRDLAGFEDRHEALFQRLSLARPFDHLSASMDLTATHLNGPHACVREDHRDRLKS